MDDRSMEMQEIFDTLSEKNKDTMILIAKGMKAAKEITEEAVRDSKQTA